MNESNNTILSRRGALRLFAGGASLAILAACGPTAATPPTAAPPKPTLLRPRPSPAATPVSSAAAPTAPSTGPNAGACGRAKTHGRHLAGRRTSRYLVARRAHQQQHPGHHPGDGIRPPDRVRRQSHAAATARRELGGHPGLQAGQTQLAQRRAVAQRPRFTSDDAKWNLLRGAIPRPARFATSTRPSGSRRSRRRTNTR